eukprot:146833-Rhodomonas_salina.1
MRILGIAIDNKKQDHRILNPLQRLQNQGQHSPRRQPDRNGPHLPTGPTQLCYTCAAAAFYF